MIDTSRFKPGTVYVIYIVTTPEKLWAALTQGEFTTQYFFGRRIESDWKVGSPVTYYMPDGSRALYGKVIECDRPRRLSLTWNVEWRDEYAKIFDRPIEELRKLPECIVSFQIDPLGDAVRLTMTEYHQGFIDEEILNKGGRSGWPVILSSLKSLLETGHSLPPFNATK